MGEQAGNKCRELSNEEKNIKRTYGRNRYQNMSEENKQRLQEYQKNHCKKKKSTEKAFIFFSLHGVKMEQKALVFEKQCINKNAFHKHKHLIDINKVGIDNIVISSKFHVAKRVHFNMSLGI